MNRRPRITAADPTCLFRSAVSVALHLDQVLFILVGNLQTLNSYMEFCFPGRTHAAIHGPDESRRAQQGVARRFLARGWVQCTNRCPPAAGFSQSRRASPEAHQSRPNLPVSRCRFPFAFCRTTAPPALQPIPEACLEYHYSKAFLLLSPASGSGWRVARHTCWANTASPGAYRQHRWGYTPR